MEDEGKMKAMEATGCRPSIVGDTRGSRGYDVLFIFFFSWGSFGGRNVTQVDWLGSLNLSSLFQRRLLFSPSAPRSNETDREKRRGTDRPAHGEEDPAVIWARIEDHSQTIAESSDCQYSDVTVLAQLSGSKMNAQEIVQA